MTQVIVRETNQTFQIELPKSYCHKLQVKSGDTLFFSNDGHSLVLGKHKPLTIEQLLEGSDEADFTLSQEDKDWLNG